MNCFWKELTLVVDVIPDVVVMVQRSYVPDVESVLLFPDVALVPDEELFRCFCYGVDCSLYFSLEILQECCCCSVDYSLYFFLETLQEYCCCNVDYFRNYVEEQFLYCVDCCTPD